VKVLFALLALAGLAFALKSEAPAIKRYIKMERM
jgi:hypothetical protein